MYKVLYCIDFYNERGGATLALLNLINSNPELEKYMIACRNCTIPEQLIYKKSGKEVVDEYVYGHYDFIHWFKSSSFNLFKEIINEGRKRKIFLNIITTVCQRPSFPAYLLSPIEIKFSSALVFIDKAAYNDTLYSFIPSNCKKMIYFGRTESLLQLLNSTLAKKKEEKNSIITYGRGSSLNKCPKDMFDIFDKINNPKRFVIVGNGDNKWIKKEIDKRRDYQVELIDGLPYQEWIEMLNSFDIFLYYLPLSAYSSIDGTLGDAMLLKKAIVYYGPEAPKERLIHGYNALVASSKDEIVLFCNKLAKNVNLRQTLGEHARETTLHDFQTKKTVEQYNFLYHQMKDTKTIKIKIPFTFRVQYVYIKFQYFCDRIFRKIFS